MERRGRRLWGKLEGKIPRTIARENHREGEMRFEFRNAK